MSRSRVIAAIVVVCGWLPASAAGRNTVALHASFTPNRLGAETTMAFGIKIGTTTGEVPTPVDKMKVQFPAGIEFTSSTLGLATCDATLLEADGPEGCSPNSVVGIGSAAVELPLGPEIFYESARVTALFGPPNNEHLENTVTLFYAEGKTPVSADLVFSTELSADTAPFGTQMTSSIQPIPAGPEGPYLSVVSFASTIGPSNLTYYKRVGGKTVAFRPRKLVLPTTCPRHGFPFAASLSFTDGSNVTARTAVPCPQHHTTVR
jgi:hypothetical protein